MERNNPNITLLCFTLALLLILVNVFLYQKKYDQEILEIKAKHKKDIINIEQNNLRHRHRPNGSIYQKGA